MKTQVRLLLAAGLLSGCIFMTGCTKSVDAFEGLEVKFTGYSTEGVAALDTSGCSDFARNNVRFTCNAVSALTNGSQVTVTANCSASDEAAAGVEIKSYTKTYTVEGLTEMSSVDPFAGLEIIVQGNAPVAKAKCDNAKCEDVVKRLGKFELSPTEGLSNGDTITIKELSGKFASSEKEYVVDSIEWEYPKELTAAQVKVLEDKAIHLIQENGFGWLSDYGSEVKQSEKEALEFVYAAYGFNGASNVYRLVCKTPAVQYPSVRFDATFYYVTIKNFAVNSDGDFAELKITNGRSGNIFSEGVAIQQDEFEAECATKGIKLTVYDDVKLP